MSLIYGGKIWSLFMQLEVSGNCPAKKNSRVGIVRNGRVMNFPSKSYRAWEQNALKELSLQARGQADGEVIVTAQFYNKDRRARDIDNQMSSVLDLLVKSGLIKSDDCFTVIECHAIFGGIDKANPRCIIDIEQVNS